MKMSNEDRNKFKACYMRSRREKMVGHKIV